MKVALSSFRHSPQNRIAGARTSDKFPGLSLPRQYVRNFCIPILSQSSSQRPVQFAHFYTALLNVSTNQADVAIVDYALAKELTGEGGAYYGKLTMKKIGFEVENFSAAVRKSDSKLLWQINEQLTLLQADGTINALAEKYSLTNQLPSNFKE